MAIVPDKLVEKVEFYEVRLPSFVANATEIGLSAEDVTDLQAKAAVARDAFKAQQKALLAARSATQEFNLAVDRLGTAGAACIKKVRARAESTGDPGIYPLASLPPIANRSPMAEPGLPNSFQAQLDGNGSLNLSWKCKNPKGSTGTTYMLNRSIDGGPFVYLGISGEKAFADNKIPAGAKKILYEIRAMRSTKAGSVAIFPVSLCSDGFAALAQFHVPTKKIRIAA